MKRNACIYALFALFLLLPTPLFADSGDAAAHFKIFCPEAAAFEPLETAAAGSVRFVPFRRTMEKLGYSVTWDGERRAARAEKSTPDGALSVEVREGADASLIDGAIYVPLDFLLEGAKPVVSQDVSGNYLLWDAELFIRNHGWTLLSDGLIAHAGGGLDGRTYLNTREALENSYANGHRVFEMDFNLTADGKLAAIHDWSRVGGRLSSAQWLAHKVEGLYGALLIDDVFRFMLEHEDAFLVTDTKSFEYSDADTKKQFGELVSAARALDASLLKRVVPQVYDQHNYAIVREVYPFASLIYTLYATPDSDAEVLAFVAAHDEVRVVTTSKDRGSALAFFEQLNTKSKAVYFFTENDEAEVAAYRTWGVHGFYTDFLLPSVKENIS